MVPQGGAHTHMRARAYDTYTHAYTGSSFGLYLSPEVQESAAYIYIGVYNIYICTYTYIYTYIKRSTSSLSLYIYIPSISIFHRPSFKRLFPRPVSEAGLHGRHSRLGRDPSTIDSETRYRNLCARERPAPSLVSPPSPPAKPRENPRLIAISPLCGLPRRLILGGEGRGGGGGATTSGLGSSARFGGLRRLSLWWLFRFFEQTGSLPEFQLGGNRFGENDWNVIEEEVIRDAEGWDSWWEYYRREGQTFVKAFVCCIDNQEWWVRL